MYDKPSFGLKTTRIFSPLRRYGLALLLVATATELTLKTQPVLGEISSFFFLAVMLSTWFGGMAPGLLATALAGWASAYYFFDIPKGTGIFGWDDALRLAVFLTISLVISSLVNLRRRAELQLRLTNENLEQRVRDRTAELEQSNRLARESEEAFRALIDCVTDSAIFMLDAAGRVVRWNTQAEKILGHGEPQVLGRPVEFIFPCHEQSADRPAEHLAAAAKSGRHEEEGWRVRKDATAFWAQAIITALYDDAGSLRGFAYVARDITNIKRLENEVLNISEREQRRIGQDLHDGLGQELTGLSFLTRIVCRKLTDRSIPEAAELDRISNMINSTIDTTRDVAKGLSPVEWGADGLAAALRNLASRVGESYGIACQFESGRTRGLSSHTAAVHLYRIAQEAVSNAARHSGGSEIRIGINDDGEDFVLTISDDGSGIDQAVTRPGGMGLRLMPYRARMIGATFDCRPRPGGGTIIRCSYRRSADSPLEFPSSLKPGSNPVES